MQRANNQELVRVLKLLGAQVGFFSLLRLTFLLWNWSQFRGHQTEEILLSFAYGLRFDIAASILLISPWLLLSLIPWSGHLKFLFSKSSFVIFVMLTLPMWALNIIDIEFVNFVGRRFTASSLFIFREFKGGGTQSFIGPYWMWLLGVLLVLVLFYRWQWKIWSSSQSSSHPIISKRTQALISLLFLTLFVIGARGGLQKKPLNFVHANIFLTPIQNNLVLNSTFTILKSASKEVLPRDAFFTDKLEMQKNLNGSISGPSLMEGRRPAGKPNVVILILESFALEYMGHINHVKGFTPFLDELAEKSLFFDHAYANGRRSIEGIGAIYAGIPALMDEPFISSEFSSNYFVGLGSILDHEGYHTSFFHGAENGSMYFDTFMKSAGVKNYFGASQYPNPADHDGAWGIYDEPFLQFFAQKLSSFPQPFFAGLFTLSSHPPYSIPEKYKAQFPPGPIEIAASISYTDFALKEFFKEAETKPWFKNTIFILTADHTQKNYLPEYDHLIGHYQVPLIFYAPGIQWPKVDTQTLAQHIDILPTVVDILGLKTESSIWLGRSLFIPGEKTITNYLEPGYLLIAKDYFLTWNKTEAPRLYSQGDLKQTHEVADKDEKAHLETRLKASLQYFSQGLWDQKLYYPTAR